MVSVCLPSDALLQHLPSYTGFSYLGRGVYLHGCSSKAQPLLLTLDEGYLLTTALPDLQRGMAPLGPPVPVQPLLCPCSHRSLDMVWLLLASDAGWLLSAVPPTSDAGKLLPATAPDLRRRVAPPATVPGLGRGVSPLGHTQCAGCSRLRLVHQPQPPELR